MCHVPLQGESSIKKAVERVCSSRGVENFHFPDSTSGLFCVTKHVSYFEPVGIVSEVVSIALL